MVRLGTQEKRSIVEMHSPLIFSVKSRGMQPALERYVIQKGLKQAHHAPWEKSGEVVQWYSV